MIWGILGIEKTEDIKKIKSAYSSLAKQYNPEEYPDKFMEIHSAYKKAIEYAKNIKKSANGDKDNSIIIENNVIMIEFDDLSKCDINFCTNTDIKNKTINKNNLTSQKNNDFDFSTLEVFSQHNTRENPLTIDEIQNIILNDMYKIVSDKDMINSFYIWTNFLNNKIVCTTISSPENVNRVDEILNHKRFIKEIAGLVSSKIGHKTKIIRNNDFGFYYIDVTGKRKLYYYVRSNRSRKLTIAYNVLWITLLFLIFLTIILIELFDLT